MKPSVDDTFFTINVKTGFRGGPEFVLDVAGASTEPGAGIIIDQFNGGDNQWWSITAVADGFFWIVNKKSRCFLSAPGSSEGQVFQSQTNAEDTQLWRFMPTGDGATNYVVNKHSGLVLDVERAEFTNGTAVIQFPRNNGVNQQWFGGEHMQG
jgi:hypothetical protein